ncbi:MAG: sigma-70 family RNA polymerase sigma factor [Pseudolabrys sp.]|nr:sigma-70 family RNA polymerase sigma factor [Pseudolabrys sp.]MDP2299045.1 sigma-70 family RNA polymerase sigma factor [Pseudolabrys sp.]
MSQRGAGWADLMRAANGGDADAYRRVLREIAAALRPLVRRGLVRAGRPAADIEDVVQEVLLAVHLKRHTWDSARPIEPWVYTIARYKLVDALRRRAGKFDLPIEDFSETLAAEGESPALSGQDVARHLAQLPPGQRAVVHAVAVEGVSIADAAVRLTMTEGAVRVALHRGLATLARALGQD